MESQFRFIIFIYFNRISRLKKVANHEASKIKFEGLEKERGKY